MSPDNTTIPAEFSVLGPPKLVRNGKTVRLHSAKATALLAYLVCRPQIAHSREALATLFWGGFSDAKARQSLRQALYSLRRSLGEVADLCLAIDTQSITFFATPRFQVDLLQFDRLVDSGSMQAALDLYQAEPLEGIALDDCPEFSEWLYFERDRVLQRMIGALQKLLDQHLSAGQSAQAVQLGQRFISLDPLNEGAYRRLMRAYAALPDFDAVRRTYRQCRDSLQRELGAEVAAQTSELYEQLLSADPVSLGHPPLPTPVPVRSFPYVGCEIELSQLGELCARAVDGELSLVFVRGEAGSGATELVNEFWRRASRQQPLLLLTGHTYEAELGAPYTMWTEALSVFNSERWQSRLADLPEVWLQQLARLVPSIKTPLPTSINASSAENQLRFMQGIVNSLIHLSRDAPLLLFFDDLQWSDTASLELLHFAARRFLSSPIFIVGAYHSDEVDNIERIQPQIDVRRHHTIDISPMRRQDIKEILDRLAVPASTAVIARLHQHSQGNRMMLVETVRLLQESGGLEKLETDGGLPIPPRIKELIETRVARLSETQRRLMAAAAVIGRPFEPILLRLVSGQPELALSLDIEALTARAFLQEPEDSSSDKISFHHDFVRQVTVENISDGHRRALHRRTAGALLDIQQSRPDLIAEEVAFHYEQAADPRALPYLLQAAEQAETFYVLSQAAKLLTRALDFERRYLEPDLEVRFDILLTREKIIAQQGQRSARAADIDSLLSLATTMDDSQRLAVAWIRQAGYLSDTHQIQDSRAAAEKALSLYRDQRDRNGEAAALRELGFLYWSTSQFGLALELGRSALKLHRQLGDLEGEATALHNLAEIHRGLNSPRRAISFYEQSLQLNWARQDHQRQCLSLYGFAHALRQLDQRQQALQKYQETLSEAELAGDQLMTSRIYHGMATLFIEIDDLDQALAAMRQAAAISREIGYAPGLAHSLFGLSYIYTLLQETGQAREALQESADWFGLMEDEVSLDIVNQRLRQLQLDPAQIEEPPPEMGWIKTYVSLVEGKVFCEYESPLARAG